MIDFHTHILPEIDDGAKTEEQAIEIIKQAQKAGFHSIIATSHYLEGHYEAEEHIRKELLEKLQEQVRVQLYLGNELYVTRNVEELLETHKLSTIHNSKYILMELPFHNKPMYLNEVVYKLLSLKKIPIIAHPERYDYVQKDPEQLQDWLEMGMLFQMNYGSMIGQYGKQVQKTAKYLLKQNYIHFLGSDTHKPNGIYLKMDKILKKIEKLIGKEKLKELSETNPASVLKNEDLEEG